MKRSSAALRRRASGDIGGQIDFDELPSYVGYQVRRTQAKIFAEFEATLGDFEFTPGSFGVLTLIRANPGVTQVAPLMAPLWFLPVLSRACPPAPSSRGQ